MSEPVSLAADEDPELDSENIYEDVALEEQVYVSLTFSRSRQDITEQKVFAWVATAFEMCFFFYLLLSQSCTFVIVE